MHIFEDESVVMKMALCGKSDEVRELLLNKEQLRLLAKIGNKPITSSELSKSEDISIQNANAKLERLLRSGYLSRENVGDPSGGNMFEYEATAMTLNHLRYIK